MRLADFCWTNVLATSLKWDRPLNTACFLSIPAAMFPDQEALVFERARLTYGQLQNRVDRLANVLRSLDLGRGSRVAVLQTNSNQYVEAFYATSKLGGTFVPLNYRAKVDELKYMVNTARVDALLLGDRYADLAMSLRDDIPSVKRWIAIETKQPEMLYLEDLLEVASADESEEDVEGDETNILMFTSGTTSLPKAVQLSYANFIEYVFGTVEPADGTRWGATLVCVPLYHIAGATTFMTSIYSGRRLVLMRQFDPQGWLHLVQQERISNAFLVPTMLKRLLDEYQSAESDLCSLETISYGAAPMPQPVIRQAIEKLPKHIGLINAFGQTETTSTVTMLLPEDHCLEGTTEEVEKKLRRLSSIGRPLPDVEVKIVDEAGQQVPRGEIGEIMVRTGRLMKGYAGAEDLTRDVLVGGWIRTRDLGWVDEDDYLFLAGRKDDLIIRGGENIAPAEIEAVLQSHPALEEAAVIGYPDEEWGEAVMAVVVLKDGAVATAEEIKEFCRQRLASFKKPERLVFIESLPRNPLGKVIKKELKAAYAARP
ncbi:MAG: long-chain-fatty-acid--CoA ligase [Chloroflexi bacterium]|nr:long-chain-fatty-acid--CoA ligase [Chloroflexota bacterium]